MCSGRLVCYDSGDLDLTARIDHTRLNLATGDDRSRFASAYSAEFGTKVALGPERSMAALAATIQLETVAEGIENTEQRDALTAFGCRYAQGYLFDRALTADHLTARLASRPGA